VPVDVESLHPEGWEEEVAALRRRTRRLRHWFWFPLIVFGILIMGSAPLYSSGSGLTLQLPNRPLGIVVSPQAVWPYYFIGLPIAYFLVVVAYGVRARRRGVATSPWLYLVFGLALVVSLALSSSGVVRLWDLPVGLAFGIGPLLSVGLVLFALSYVERSWFLAAVSAVFFAWSAWLSVVSGHTPVTMVDVFLAGLFLALCGLGSLLAHRRTT